MAVHSEDAPRNPCGEYYQVQGSVASFSAEIVGLRTRSPVRNVYYHWQADGYIPGPIDEQRISLEFTLLGNARVTAQVGVGTDTEDGYHQATIIVPVITPEEAELWELVCALQSHAIPVPVPARARVGLGSGVTAGGIRFVDPLWDPTPEVLRQAENGRRPGYSLHDLYQLHGAAERLAGAASAVAHQASCVIHEREERPLGSAAHSQAEPGSERPGQEQG